jgi:hypothetical protein
MAEAECGCRVEIDDDTIHVWPCSIEHEPAMTSAARELAQQTGIELELVEPS